MLSADALELITWASLFPAGTSESVLYRLLDRSPDDFRLAIEETFELHLLRTEESKSGSAIVFNDQQYRQQVYGRLSLMRQKEMHQHIGKALEQELIYTNDFRQVEYHYRKANDLIAITKLEHALCDQIFMNFEPADSGHFISER